uniref:Nck-associated protein 1 n=1 Tax=Heligmosomoides polygyrus TaxID=6339 RepID=A0A183GWS2_HELPZ
LQEMRTFFHAAVVAHLEGAQMLVEDALLQIVLNISSVSSLYDYFTKCP